LRIRKLYECSNRDRDVEQGRRATAPDDAGLNLVGRSPLNDDFIDKAA